MHWGISEALDLYGEYINAFKSIDDNNKETLPIESKGKAAKNPDQLNILLFGNSDPRHVIKTCAKLYKYEEIINSINEEEEIMDQTRITPKINFYLVDEITDIVARNIALLAIAFESPEAFQLKHQAHLFMDVYGNSLLRPISNQYLNSKSKTLMEILTDAEVLNRLAPMLSIDTLKYNERDSIGMAFDFWLPKVENRFNIESYWTGQLRTYLKQRYDFRSGAFDWDLNMILKRRGAQQLCSQEYRHWRECGVAFVYPEYEHCKPNKTFAMGLMRNGNNYYHRGYIGDLITGPFCTFGIKTTDERMTKSSHGENDYRATDITERNLMELFHELRTRKPYIHDLETSRKYGSVKLVTGNRFTGNEQKEPTELESFDKPWINIDGVKIHFLSCNETVDMQSDTTRYRNFFDLIFVGRRYFPIVKSNFYQLLKDKAVLIIESRLLTNINQDQLTKLETEIKQFGKSGNLESVLNYDALNGNFTTFKFKKNNAEKMKPPTANTE